MLPLRICNCIWTARYFGITIHNIGLQIIKWSIRVRLLQWPTDKKIATIPNNILEIFQEYDMVTMRPNSAARTKTEKLFMFYLMKTRSYFKKQKHKYIKEDVSITLMSYAAGSITCTLLENSLSQTLQNDGWADGCQQLVLWGDLLPPHLVSTSAHRNASRDDVCLSDLLPIKNDKEWQEQ